MNDFLNERRRGVEEAFFARHNEDLRTRLRGAEGRPAPAATGSVLTDDLLEDDGILTAAEGSSDTAAALSLVPLVVVAWADDAMSPKERDALLSAVSEAGLSRSGASYEAFEAWLEEKPGPELLEQWRAYVRALCIDLSAEAREQLRSSVIGKARQVASAAGGFLGIGAVSAAEQAVLDDLDATFSA